MKWNWQSPDWPNFKWNRSRLSAAEEQFLLGAGIAIGTVKHLAEDEHNQLLVEVMSGEAVTTSAIEGEVLNRASVQSSILRQLGLASPDKRRAMPAEEGIAEMMVDLYRSFSNPLSDEMLFGWHRMLTTGRKDLADIGRYRTSKEPMQVISGRIGAPIVHFEAPPSKQVPAEMKRFISWFNRTAPQGKEALPAITRAGAAHLFFESIHPFEDGNGRIGRAIAEKAMPQSFGQPVLVSLATTILEHQKNYYEALERANKQIDITEWLLWFAGIALEAQRRSIAQVEFLIAKAKMMNGLRGQINERQRKALLRMFREGPEGFKGGLSAGNYSTITGASPATTTRDLADLAEKGALRRTGERKHARYALNLKQE
ncbi:Fic family protein [Terracidiphilus sp.]|jgi:Fic family protein|uniref:Fic family protein n=1 Tax=Terracidiphilus sp. TaxID=1964191 RepID=UPI003C203605